METLLDSRAKTVPSNYNVRGLDMVVPGSEEPGYSLTPEQWAKAERMNDPNYDWTSYQNAIKNSLFDHPALAHREHEEATITEWNEILGDLEPFNARSVV